MITVVGGVYREVCVRPQTDEIYGSAGRAAAAIAEYAGENQVELYCYLDQNLKDVIESIANIYGFQVNPTDVEQGVAFEYLHGLSEPKVYKPVETYQPISVIAEKVIRFGMLEGSAVIDCKYAVYDPQNAQTPESFRTNGSSVEHLALILNQNEAIAMAKLYNADIKDVARALAVREQAEVVVIKMGPRGALVYFNGEFSTVQAYKTDQVSKIGSGDMFVAHFSYFWMEEGKTPHDAAESASKATAYYCWNRGFPTRNGLESYKPTPLVPSQNYRDGRIPTVYLAGPFFTLGQLWMIEEARNHLLSMGLNVFSPYHNVGTGPAEDVVGPDLDGIRTSNVLFAIVDGLDPGTIFEIGYAQALEKSKPVVVYAENESDEDLKMMTGSGCAMSKDYVTAIYKAAWAAIEAE
ncbi:PfkB family carbohydrate kinase [Pseudomonas bijieensis]|uniref:PfkB family carbohydrate kinase n=1 Tax=Pseudomonas bijieensis TaxID=2681983 RepID=UPI00200F7C92|nr:PfkB family carbohydrate kinase [Pseudomonas bijieensis]UQI31966.1 PfkB family carbohydrate kinase [Pseudomonas bijieensis]